MPATAHLSYWHETAGGLATHFPALEQNLQVDVAIIGGGITGLTAAWHLKQAGKRVAVLEAGQIGAGTTGFTSGHLDATTDLALSRMILDFGQASAATVTAATREAIDQIGIHCGRWPDCEFSRIPSYQFTESAAGLDALQKQCAAARKLGFNSWFTRQVPLPFHCVGAVQTANQGRLHSVRYLQHLAMEIDGDGAAIFENTQASPPVDGVPCVIQTPGGRVTAENVFVATHSPFLGISQFDFRVFPYQSYVIAARVQDDVPDAIYWDDAAPYHYLRLASPHDPTLLLIGGADHKTAHARDERDHFAVLEQYAGERFSGVSVEQAWSAQHYVPADGLPHIGRVPTSDHLFIATGFAGVGLTWGTVAGLFTAKLMLGEHHPLEQILAPGRITVMASAPNMIFENLDAVRRFALDRFSASSAADDEVAPGTGRLVRRNGQMVAVYRNPAGAIFHLSPVCTHAGCIVHWNQAEQTWDCPCHGGRFTGAGLRLSGPPAEPLKSAHEEVSTS